MSLSPPPPPLPKLPFILGDVALLAFAWFLAQRQPGPLTPEITFAVTACVLVGAVLAVIPFLADYARRQDDALDDRQRTLEVLARTVATAGEQIGIAAGGFNEVSELAHKNLKQAEQLPHRLQEKIAEFNALLDHAREDDREDLEKEIAELRASESDRLQVTADKIQKAVAQLTQLEAALRTHLTATTAALADASSAARSIPPLPPLPTPASAALPALLPTTPAPQPHPTAAVAAPITPAPTSPPKAPVAPVRSAPQTTPSVESSPRPGPTASPEIHDAPSLPSPEPKLAPKKRPAKKSVPVEDELLLGLESDDGVQATPDESESSTAAEIGERVISSDGATRLLVTAYIGIGNRLFIRGDGPGLNWGKGVPLEFVSIGKWRWETDSATAPVALKLYKNDSVECATLGTLTLDPGHQQEVTAKFA